MAAEVFVSFASKDTRVAMTLCTALESRGFSCWISARDIEPGANFQSSIVRALRSAKIMLLVFTANSNTSEEMTKELALASQNKMIVIPLRVEDVAPNDAFAYEFATRQWIDVFADWETAMEQLARRVSNALVERQAGLVSSEASDALMSMMSAAAGGAEAADMLPDPAPAPPAEPVLDVAPAQALKQPAPVPPAAPATPSVAPADAPSTAKSRLPVLVAGGAAAVLAIGIAAAVTMSAKRGPHRPAAPSAASATHAPSTAPAGNPSWAKVDQQAEAVLAAAKGAGQEPAQIAGLSDSVSRIGALTSQARTLEAAPGGAAKLPAIVGQINDEAASLSQKEAAALDHAASVQARQAEHILGKAKSSDASNALSAVRQAKTKLAYADSAVSNASDASSALQATSGAIAAYGEFTSAFNAASPYFAVAEHAEIAALVTDTRAMSARILSYSAKPKPWFLAPQRQKQAYQTLQTNAAQARARQAELEALGRSATKSAGLKALDADFTRASAINKAVKELYASSYAAYSVK